MSGDCACVGAGALLAALAAAVKVVEVVACGKEEVLVLVESHPLSSPTPCSPLAASSWY